MQTVFLRNGRHCVRPTAGSDVTSSLIGYRPTGDARSHYVNVDWLSVADSITRSPELTEINNFVPITMSGDDRSHYENVYWLSIADSATDSHGQRSGAFHSSVVVTGSTRVIRLGVAMRPKFRQVPSSPVNKRSYSAGRPAWERGATPPILK